MADYWGAGTRLQATASRGPRACRDRQRPACTQVSGTGSLKQPSSPYALKQKSLDSATRGAQPFHPGCQPSTGWMWLVGQAQPSRQTWGEEVSPTI